MRRTSLVLRLWPILAAAFFAGPFNFWAIAGWLELMGIRGGREQLFLQVICSQVEMYFWWQFLGWGPKMIREADVVQELIDEFKTEGFPVEFRGLAEHAKGTVQRVWTWLKAKILGNSGEDSTGWVQRLAAIVRRSFAPFGYMLVYALGSVPTWNIVVGVPLCRIVHLPGALAVLMLGNINTVVANTVLKELILWLWREHRLSLVVGGGGVAVLAYAWRRRRRR